MTIFKLLIFFFINVVKQLNLGRSQKKALGSPIIFCFCTHIGLLFVNSNGKRMIKL